MRYIHKIGISIKSYNFIKLLHMVIQSVIIYSQ